MKRYVMTGGSGFIGSHLMKQWLSDGIHLRVLTRNPDALLKRWSDYPDQLVAVSDWENMPADPVDVVVNLSGEGIADKRWTDARKQALRDSRIRVTDDLVRWMKQHNLQADIVLSGSAIGIYGDAGDVICTEESGSFSGDGDFAANLCREWENSSVHLADHAQHVCVLRTGVVLGRDGGMLSRLTLPFSLGLGGRLGAGEQYLSWIHIEDYCHAIDWIIKNNIEGAINMTAPEPVTNADFTRALAGTLKRPAFFHAPSCILKTVLGEMSSLLLGGQKVVPQRLQSEGFHYAYPDISSALHNIYK